MHINFLPALCLNSKLHVLAEASSISSPKHMVVFSWGVNHSRLLGKSPIDIGRFLAYVDYSSDSRPQLEPTLEDGLVWGQVDLLGGLGHNT